MKEAKFMKRKNLTISNGFDVNIQKETHERGKRSDRSKISQITNNIHLSGMNPLNDQNTLNSFTHILNCTESTNGTPEHVKILNLKIKDEPSFNIILHLLLAIEFIEDAIKSNGKILIHCMEGVSRSPTILAGYLMWKYGYECETALKLIKDKRESIDINFGFIIQLNAFSNLVENSKELRKFYFDSNFKLSVSKFEENQDKSDNSLFQFYKNSMVYKNIIDTKSRVLEST